MLVNLAVAGETNKQKVINVLKTIIADADANFRGLIKQLLAGEPDIEVIGEATNGREAVSKTKTLKPDLVLMDVRMPVMNGLEATRQLKAEMPETKVIILTMFDLLGYREAAMASGAKGHVTKKHIIGTLVPSIREVFKETTPIIAGELNGANDLFGRGICRPAGPAEDSGSGETVMSETGR